VDKKSRPKKNAAIAPAAARVGVLIPTGTPTVEIERLERSISALRAFGLDPITILRHAADGETLFRQSVKSDTHDEDVVRLLAESDDLPLYSPSMQAELFRARNREEPLKERRTFSDKVGAVLAGRHPLVRGWRVPMNGRLAVFRFEALHEIAEEIKRIDGSIQWFADEQALLAWMKRCSPPPSWLVAHGGMERFAHVLAHYRKQYRNHRRRPYLEMAAALRSEGGPAQSVALAKSELAKRKKAAGRAKGTKP